MGWNGYNAFGCSTELTEAKLKDTVQALNASGMQSAGYRFVNLDDCWQLARSPEGKRVFDPARLPGGISALSSYLHDRGFSFGLFSTTEDCAGSPGAVGFEAIDAQSYAAWGLDYFKYASCTPAQEDEGTVADSVAALRAEGRPITVSLAAPPFQEWMRDAVQLWRTSGNAAPTWSSIERSIDATIPLAAYARPGAFNDPDMLEIGNGTLTAGEKRVQFSVWSILSAPLLAGNDLTAMTEETRAILTNDRVIALNQDPLGLQGALIRREGSVDVLAKPLAECGARGVVLWNRGDTSAAVSLTWQELWLDSATPSVRDLWSDTPVAVDAQSVTVTVASHDAVALRVQGVEPPRPRGRVALSDLRWTYATNGFGPVELDRTNGEDKPLDGQPIRLRGAAHEKGLGVHGPSLIRYRLGRACTRFFADIGIDDDQQGQGSVNFEVWADGERLFQSGRLTGTSPTRTLDLDISGRRELRLFVGNGGDSTGLDHAVWAGATLECDSEMGTP
jgi:alpha-galactosidase